MTDLTPSGAGDSAPANDAPLSIREAADAYAQRRETEQSSAPDREPNGRFRGAEREAPEPVEPDSPIPSNEGYAAADDSQLPGDDDQGQVDPADDQPSIEPPRSWTKEEKEAFKLLPPEHQQRIAERERTREAEIRRGQDKAAEERKAAEAERQRLEQARQQYENALPQLLQTLNATQQAEFADIQSEADVVKMAEEDPFRYAKWDALQKQRQSAYQRWQHAQQRQQQEQAERFTNWAKEQDQRVLERIPELADPEKAPKVQKEAISYLTETVGWDQERIARMWQGQEPIYARDADFQLILRDAARWRSAEKAAKAAATKPVPPVQRPGVPPSKADVSAQNIKALETRLERATTTQEQIRLASQLRAAKRAGAGR